MFEKNNKFLGKAKLTGKKMSERRLQFLSQLGTNCGKMIDSAKTVLYLRDTIELAAI